MFDRGLLIFAVASRTQSDYNNTVPVVKNVLTERVNSVDKITRHKRSC